MNRHCILFFGPAGVNARGSLQKLADYCERRGLQRPELVVLHDKMIDKHLESYPNDPNKPVMRQPGGFQYLLLQPKQYLLKLWRDSAEEALAQIPPTKEIIFLSTHSVFYHTWNRDFFQCIDLNHFRTCLKDLTINLVITLADDIHDCWRRLKEPGQLFAPTDNIVQSILDLFLLLSWRSMEMFASEQIARDFGVPHFLLAVKHPLSVAYDLMFSQKIPAYIAHPISEVRDLEHQGNMEAAEKIKSEIQLLIELLVNSSVILPIFPTSIDELILETDSQYTEKYIAKLGTRWPIGNLDDILFLPPSGNTIEPFSLPGATKDGAMSLLLRGLVDNIKGQVNFRDRILVEQTKVLIVWRPYCNGHISGGVSNKLNHRKMMVDRGLCTKEDRPAIVLIRPTDLAFFRIDNIYDLLVKRAQKLPDDIKVDSIRERLIPSALQKLIHNEGEVLPEELSKTIDPTKKVIFPLPRAKISALAPREDLSRELERNKHWTEICSETNKSFPPFDFLDKDTLLYEQSLTVPEFVKHVEEILGI